MISVGVVQLMVLPSVVSCLTKIQDGANWSSCPEKDTVIFGVLPQPSSLCMHDYTYKDFLPGSPVITAENDDYEQQW